MESNTVSEDDSLKDRINLLPTDISQGPNEKNFKVNNFFMDLNTPPGTTINDVPDNFELPMFNIDTQFTVNDNQHSNMFQNSLQPNSSYNQQYSQPLPPQNHGQQQDQYQGNTNNKNSLYFDLNALAPPERRGRSSSFSDSIYSEILLNANLPFVDAALQFSGYDGPPNFQVPSIHGQAGNVQQLFFDQDIQLGGLVSNTNLAGISNMTASSSQYLGNSRLTQDNLDLLGNDGQIKDMNLNFEINENLVYQDNRNDQNIQNIQTQIDLQGVQNLQIHSPQPISKGGALKYDNLPNYSNTGVYNFADSLSSINPSSTAAHASRTPAGGDLGVSGYLGDPLAAAGGTTSMHESDLEHNYPGVTISIDAAPEIQAARTPSLFSNSLHSSLNNSPSVNKSNNSSTHLQTSSSYTQLSVQSPGLLSDYSELLKPDEFSQMRRGRRSQHSASRLRSRLRLPFSDNGADYSDNDGDLKQENVYEDLGVANSSSSTTKRTNPASREKMLELALPNQVMRRTQKHPSVYECNLCEKKFTRPYNLKSHLRTHTDERPFICNVCGKAFARQHDRKRHEDLHSGEKKYQCRGLLKNGQQYGCGRKFARADALRRHFQTETGKECIRLLLEEDERERDDPLQREGSEGLGKFEVPTVAISPPD